jgi:hypothetical protein
MVGAYAAVGFASSTVPKALWSTNPVTITFSGSAGTGSSGSIGEFVKCAPKLTDVVFQTKVDSPAKIALTTDPKGEATCGPAPDVVTVTATCPVAAPNCEGTYTGTVTILQGYSTILPSLTVNIIVT